MKIKDKTAIQPNTSIMLSAIIVILLSVIGFALYLLPPNSSENEDGISIKSVEIMKSNNDFVITIIAEGKRDINETSWVILNQDGKTLKKGETYYIYDYGNIGIEGSKIEERENSKGGYMKDNEGKNLTNAIEYWTNYAPNFSSKTEYSILMGNETNTNRVIAFQNNDEKSETNGWKFSNEDQYFIRGPQNFPNETTPKILLGYKFGIVFDPTNEYILRIQLE